MSAPNLVRLSDITPRSVEYLWTGRIPAGKVTLLTGNPDVGKSMLTHEIVARITRPQTWPDGATALAEPASAILLSAEDDPEDTICPRLMAAGADLSRVRVLKSVMLEGEGGKIVDRWPSLATDLDAIRLAIRTGENVRLIIIDPLTAYLGDADSNTDSKVRGILGPLAEMAATTGVAVIVIVHSNKSAVQQAIHRVGGSVAFVGVARVVLLVARDPKDPERHLLVRVKNNLSRDRTGMAFRIVACSVPGLSDAQPRIEWEPGALDLDADDVMAAQAAAREDGGPLARACAWLRKRLSAGGVDARVLQSEAEASGLARRTVERAKSELGIRSRLKGSGESRCSLWELPDDRQVPEDLTPASGIGGVGGLAPKGETPEAESGAQDRQERQGRQESHYVPVAGLNDARSERVFGDVGGAEVDPHEAEERRAIQDEAQPRTVEGDTCASGSTRLEP